MRSARINCIRQKRNRRRVAVGRVDKKPIPGIPGNLIVARFRTMGEGERFIDKIAEHDKKGVKNGEYYIDVPEDMQIAKVRRDKKKKK